jgi:hypothetical protein
MWRVISIPAILAILSVTPATRGPATADAAAELRALEDTWLKAATTHDTKTLDALLASDFTHIDYRGRLRSRADALHAPVAPADMRQTLSDERVRIYDTIGIVTGVNTVTTPGGKEQLRLRFTDVFVRAGSGWQAVSAQETPENP